MKIDYDKLRATVDIYERCDSQWEQLDASLQLDSESYALACEALRLRDGMSEIAESLGTLVDMMAKDTYFAQARYVRKHVDRINELLKGNDE